MTAPPMIAKAIETNTIRRVTRRLMPLIVVCYIIAYIDRSNISIAALTMNADLGLTAAQFGIGSGIFFLGYVALEVPSNIVLARVGARRWIARIMITWGIVALLMAFMTEAWHFYVLRLLLGAAEAGFTPAIIFYLATWYPNRYRARAVSSFYVGAALATVIGAPLGGLILNSMDGVWGHAGWQWLFALEALPAIILAFVVLKFLTDTPERADWLPAENRIWLLDTLRRERTSAERVRKFTIGQALRNPGVLMMALFLFLFSVNSLGLTLWMPQVISNTFVVNPLTSSLLTAVPYAFAVVLMIIVARLTDRYGRMHLFMAWPMVASGLLMLGSLAAGPTVLGFLALSLSTACAWATLPALWKSATGYMTGVAAAAGIALINSLGNIAGLTVAPLIGHLKDSTGTFIVPLFIIAGAMLLAAIVGAATRRFVSITGELPDDGQDAPVSAPEEARP